MSRVSRDLSSRVSEGQDIIDTRDIVERIEELEAGRLCSSCNGDAADENGPCENCCSDLIEGDYSDPQPGVSTSWLEDYEEELKALKQVREDYCGSEGFEDGAALIADHYFQTYAEELADDIGAIDRNASWPVNCIDWEEAARQLQQDYSSLDYGSTTYWFRS